jgi:hypothetical protein
MIEVSPAQVLPDLEKWVQILGAEDSPEHVPVWRLQNPSLAFRVLDSVEREQTFLKVTKVLQTPLEKSGDHRKARWAAGWQENLDEFVASGYDLDALQAKFVRRGQIMRVGANFVEPQTDQLESALVGVLREYLFSRYFHAVDPVYEFGAGTGHNMAALAQQYPEKTIHALDWVEPAVQIYELLRTARGLNIHGHLFDLGNPDPSYQLLPSGGVLTVGALEQLGGRFEPFLAYLLQQRPAICVHVETMYELYNQETLFDWLGAQYLEKRGYLIGYLTALRRLEEQGHIEILKVQRTFGSLYHDGYTYVVWRPVNNV